MQIGTCTDASGTSGFETRRAESVPTSRVPQSLLRESVPTSPPHDGVPTSPPRDDVPTSPLRDDITSRNSETKLPIPRPPGGVSLSLLYHEACGSNPSASHAFRMSSGMAASNVNTSPVLGCVTVSLAACNACLPSHRAPLHSSAPAPVAAAAASSLLSAGAAPPQRTCGPYRGSETMGSDACARCTRIWCVRPVNGRACTSAAVSPGFRGSALADTTAHSVTAGFGTDESWSGCPPGRAFGSGGGGGWTHRASGMVACAPTCASTRNARPASDVGSVGLGPDARVPDVSVPGQPIPVSVPAS